MNQCFDRGWITQGEFVQQAERELCRLTGRKYAICVASGTMALHLAHLALGIKFPAVPSMTFPAVPNTAIHAGARLYFLGADPDTWQISMQDVEALPSYVDAVVAAPCYGGLGPMDLIQQYCEQHDLWLIEDAAESFGGEIAGRPAGSFGDVSCVSFYANKILTAGEGGAVLTDDEVLADRIYRLANHGLASRFRSDMVAEEYEPLEIGLNGRMTDLQAAILCGQLERLPTLLQRRQELIQLYDLGLSVRRPQRLSSEYRAPWLYPVLVDDRDAVRRQLLAAGCETRPFFYPGHMAKIYDAHWLGRSQSCSTAEELWRHGLLLPLHPLLTQIEAIGIAQILNG